MTVINTNVGALVAQDALGVNAKKLSLAMERLSTGSKVNSAKDDAAGLAIATRMDTQVRGLSTAIRNANDGISLLQTTEGAMEEITSMLQRMRELSLQSSSAVNNAQDRSALDAEVQQLKAEIDRISSTTTFNNQKVLDGSMTGKRLQIGQEAGQVLEFSLSSMASTDIGKTALTNSSLATTAASASGKPAVETVAQLAFFGDDSYTFKVDGTTVTGSVVSGSPAGIVDNINNALKAAGNTSVSASLVNGAVELRNKLGGNIGVTNFSSVGNGKATFNVISGGGSTTILDDTSAVTTSGAAVGSAASTTGVTLSLANTAPGSTARGSYEMKVNGVSVSVAITDTDANIQTKLKAALGSSYEVFIAADVITTGAASGNFAAAAGNAAYTSGTTTFGTATGSNGFGLAAGQFVIWSSSSNVPINITEFQATDGVAAGTKGTIRAVGNNTEAILVDGTNKFTVPEAGNGNVTELSLAFTSTTSDYDIKIDGAQFTITAADLQAGTAGTSLITAINALAVNKMNLAATVGTATDADYGLAGGTQDMVAAGGLASLGNTIAATTSTATKIGYEIVQNGSTLTIKKAGDFGKLVAEVDESGTNGANGITATAGTAASAATFKTNASTGLPDAGTNVDLNTTATALFQTTAATPTKMSLEFSGDATYTFNLTNLAGTGQYTTTAVNAAVVGGSVASMITTINNLTTYTGITASADPNNSRSVILERSDGKKIQLGSFTSTGNATVLATPSAGQGVAKVLNDDSNSVQATATAAGAATATVAKMTFSATDKVSFKVFDGRTTSIVRAISTTTGGTQGADLLAEINSALAGSDITATKALVGGLTEITFTNSLGGKIEVTAFKSDGTSTATFAPNTGQGVAVILDDNGGASASGKSVADIDIATSSASDEALGVIDNALQQVSDERAKLGALQNRLNHTVSNLANIVTNTQASRSRIMDTDYAAETSNLAKAQIIQQAATAMLAQANQSAQSVLSLLQ
jgi:flagellin